MTKFSRNKNNKMARFARKKKLVEEGRDFIPKKARSPSRSPLPKKII